MQQADQDKKRDRRKKKRFLVLKDMDIPITMQVHDKEDLEGILLNLSARGIGLISFTPLEQGAKIQLSLQLDQLKVDNLKGRVIWSERYKDTCRVGIQFTRIDRKMAKMIDQIAEDYIDCEIKITLGVKDICFLQCKYYNFCRKPQKL